VTAIIRPPMPCGTPAPAGCLVAACDWNPDTVAETAVASRAGAPPGVAAASHACDVPDEPHVLRFRDEALQQHRRAGQHQQRERPVGVARPSAPNIASGTAKFAVLGFIEALIEDLRVNAPRAWAAVVVRGNVGTRILAITRRAHREPGLEPRGGPQMADARSWLTTPACWPQAHQTTRSARWARDARETRGRLRLRRAVQRVTGKRRRREHLTRGRRCTGEISDRRGR
jgi:hypothetical protein